MCHEGDSDATAICGARWNPPITLRQRDLNQIHLTTSLTLGKKGSWATLAEANIKSM
jgi:hypothetical protein